MSAAKIINTLWPVVAKHLTDDQLERLGYSDLHGTLGKAAEVMMCIGCLVAEDERHDIPAGNFQEPESVAKLLCFFSGVIADAAEVSRVSNDAKTILHQRQLDRATKQHEEVRNG